MDLEYFYEVVEAVRSAHTSCDTVTYVIQMQEGCNAACSKVIKHIKDNTIKYLKAGWTPITVDDQVEHKALRGLNDYNIGCLLIPAESLHEWDKDPDVYIDQSPAVVCL